MTYHNAIILYTIQCIKLTHRSTFYHALRWHSSKKENHQFSEEYYYDKVLHHILLWAFINVIIVSGEISPANVRTWSRVRPDHSLHVAHVRPHSVRFSSILCGMVVCRLSILYRNRLVVYSIKENSQRGNIILFNWLTNWSGDCRYTTDTSPTTLTYQITSAKGIFSRFL